MEDAKRLEVLREELEAEGYHNLKVLPEVGICGMKNFIFTTAIVIGITNDGYKGRYCFENPLECLLSFEIWNGKGMPKGNWIKYKGVGGEFRNENMH